LSQLFEELKRRNVFRVGIAYAVVAWLIIQVADIVLDNIAAPDWLMKALMFFLLIGFPIAVLFAWAYEMTPEGIKREKDVDRSTSITQHTGQKLNRTIIVVLVAAVGFLLVDKFFLQDTVSTVATEIDKSVAVLPFVAMSRGPDDEYFADGLTEEILNSLTRVPELLVTARTSAFHFKGQDVPIPEIADKLGVAHIVEGSVRRDGDQLRVTAQLIRASDGFHLWSENYDRSTEGTFGVQTDIAEKIASALGVYLDDETVAHMKSSGFRSPEAYVMFQKARELFEHAHNDYDMAPMLLEANALLEQVTALEPNTSRAFVLHSDYYVHQLRENNHNLSDEERVAMAEALRQDFDAAVRTAADDEARLAASFDRALLLGNWESVSDIFDALASVAVCPGIMWGNINTLEFGRADTFLKLAQRAVECDPQNPFSWWDSVQGHNWLGDFDTGIEVGEKAMDLAPHNNTWQALAISYLGAGRFEDAERSIGRYAQNEASAAEVRFLIAAAQGDAERARSLLDEIVRLRPELYAVHLNYVAQIGDRENANRIAAEIDALPYGYLSLMGVPVGCYCGAPWDLEVTPNYARLIEEGGFNWPPASPIDWPLKDW